MPDLLVFDGDCGFCTKSVDVIRSYVRPDVTFEPWQFLDLDELQLTIEQVDRAVQWIPQDDGRRHSGAAAFARVLRRSPMIAWRGLGYVIAIPPISWLAAGVYRLIADNRHHLPGGTPACVMPASAQSDR